MKALKLISPGNLRVMKKLSMPKLSNDSIIIKVKYCGICSSDIKFIDKGHRIKKYPIILGHEISGNVYKVGKKIKKFKVGDHVVLGAEVPCNEKNKCFFCKKNKKIYCEKQQSVGTTINGGFADYIKIDKNFINNGPIIKITKNIDHKYTCMAESIACVINGLEFSEIIDKSSVLILGSGYIGLLFLLLCKKYYKFKNVSIVDLNLNRLKIAQTLGADCILETNINNKDLTKKIIKLNNNKKFDFVVSANNNIISHRVAPNLVNKGGCVNLFGGIPKGKNDIIKISSNYIHYNQIKIGGTFSSDINHLKKAVSFNNFLFGNLRF